MQQWNRRNDEVKITRYIYWLSRQRRLETLPRTHFICFSSVTSDDFTVKFRGSIKFLDNLINVYKGVTRDVEAAK